MTVSVERACRKPDCRGGRRSPSDKYSISWRATRRSSSCERTDRLEIGRYELALVASSPGFFRKERKEDSIYIAPLSTHILTKRSGMDHTVLPANSTMPAFPS